jgi:hypothetical protein
MSPLRPVEVELLTKKSSRDERLLPTGGVVDV